MKKNFTEAENNDHACRAHSGVWDHGSTGTRMKDYIKEFNITNKSNLEKHIVMWEPHWTCCRKEWKAPGIINYYL